MAVIDDTKQIKCSFHDEMARKVNEMHTALIGDTEGRGWIPRMLQMEGALKIVGRAMWSGLGVFFLVFCSFVWALLTHTIDIVAK
jgi:hypothetical protein